MPFVFVPEAQGKHLKNRIKKEIWVYWDSPLCQGTEAGIRVSAPWLGSRLDLGVPLAFSGPAWPKEWGRECKVDRMEMQHGREGKVYTCAQACVFVSFYSIFYLKIFLSIVNLQYCVHFKCTAKQFSYTHAYSCSFLILIWFFPHIAVIEYWAVFPVLYSWPLLVICLDLVCMLIIGVYVWTGFYEHGEKRVERPRLGCYCILWWGVGRRDKWRKWLTET